MALVRRWAGRVFGTNTGNVFVKLDGPDAALTGTLHHNETGFGVAVYVLHGSFGGEQLQVTGEPANQIEGVRLGRLTASATLNSRGELVGEWSADIGSAGTLHLYPHDQDQGSDRLDGGMAEQLHTARHQFGAIAVSRDEIIAIADDIQRDFKKSPVVVTVMMGTEQSRFLADFRTMQFGSERAEVIKLFARESEGGGLDRIIQVEFGQQINFAMTQSSDEAWVLGSLEKLKRAIKPFKQDYATNFNKVNFGIRQILLFGAVAFLPSLPGLKERVILMLGVLILVFGVEWLHRRYLPLAAIYLGGRPKPLTARMIPALMSWVIAVTASLVAALLAAYLAGWLFPGQRV